MKKKTMMCMAAVMCLCCGMTAYAAPETMQDGTVFDAEYGAQTSPDVAAEAEIPVKKLLKKKAHYVWTGGLDGYIAYEYDAQGNMINELDYNNEGYIILKYLYSYDARGNLIQELSVDPSNDNPLFVTTYSYDSQNNMIGREVYDRNQIKAWDEKYSYDNQGNLIEDYFLHYGNYFKNNTYSYDNQGNLIEAKHFAGTYRAMASRNLYTYDTCGNLIQEAYETGGIIRTYYLYSYDDRGNVTEEQYISADGTLRHDIRYAYEYDAQGNMVRKEEYKYELTNDGLNVGLTEKHFYYYDADGDLVREESGKNFNNPGDEFGMGSYTVYEY